MIENIADGFADRLRRAIGNLSQREYARRVGVSETTIRSYLSGETYPGLDKIASLAMVGGVEPIWLASGVSPFAEEGAAKSLMLPAGKYHLIPRQDVKAAAGDAVLLPAKEIVDYALFETEFLRRELGVDPKNLVLIQAKGDSMEPTIRDGDLLLVDWSQAYEADNAIYVLNVDGRIMVKRLQFQLDGTIEVLSDNPKYTPQTVTPQTNDLFRLVGRVVWSGGRI